MKLTATILALALSASTAAQAQHSTAHVPSISDSELQAQIQENLRSIDVTSEAILAAGGPDKAPFVPVWMATHSRVHWEAFGEGKQIGSNGGE